MTKRRKANRNVQCARCLTVYHNCHRRCPWCCHAVKLEVSTNNVPWQGHAGASETSGKEVS
jgi:hypothetical protein